MSNDTVNANASEPVQDRRGSRHTNHPTSDRRGPQREQAQNVLRTVVAKYHETLARLPRMRLEVEAQLTKYVGVGVDFQALAATLESQLQEAQTFLLAVDLSPVDYPELPDLPKYGQSLAAVMTTQTVRALAFKFEQRSLGVATTQPLSVLMGSSLVQGLQPLTMQPPDLASVSVSALPASSLKPGRLTSLANLTSLGYVDNGDGTVTDTHSHLMWRQDAQGQTGVDGTGTANFYTWHNATEVAEQLNLRGGFAGHGDWRLPTVKELESLLRPEQVPSISLEAFPQAPSEGFWTVSEFNNYYAWTVDFKQGKSIYDSRLAKCCVRLVRSMPVL